MNLEPDNDYNEIFSEVDIFLKKDLIENVNISIHNKEFNYMSFTLPVDSTFNIEELYNYLEEENRDKLYVITTVVPYLDAPELKKYFIPYSQLNEFLYIVNDPEFEENIISVNLAEDR